MRQLAGRFEAGSGSAGGIGSNVVAPAQAANGAAAQAKAPSTAATGSGLPVPSSVAEQGAEAAEPADRQAPLHGQPWDEAKVPGMWHCNLKDGQWHLWHIVQAGRQRGRGGRG